MLVPQSVIDRLEKVHRDLENQMLDLEKETQVHNF